MVNIRSYLKHANISQSPFPFNFKSYLKNNGILEGYLKADTDIVYKRGNNEISYRNNLLNASILISKEDLSLEKMSFIGDKRNIIPDIFAKKADIKSFLSKETVNDFTITLDSIRELDIDYLGVKYFAINTSAGIELRIKNIGESEEYSIKLENASSGMQTVTPLSVIVEYFSKYYDFIKRFNEIILSYLSQSDNLKDFRAGLNIGEIKHKNIHLHIEEPELSLYPESQRSLINFIVNRCFIQEHNDYKMTVMMATHSPYIINHLNLLIKAYDKKTLVEGASLNYDDIAVYQIDEGKIYDLKAQNVKLINTNPLSDTIDDIYDQYDKLG
ncbi:hypothetical protein AGMMS4957_13430 [Bacteroidia bacterium]|nr:hypothetical protein AGMMS4957_13430 [Bacteroidia bacterium]